MKTGKRKKEWFDDDALWRETYPFLFPEKRFTDAPEQLEKMLRLAPPKGSSALDLCCGPGRFSIALARKGFAVTGVDRTGFLLDKARAAAKAQRLQVEWVRKDMRDFVRENAYDLALSTFTSFGYFENRDDDEAVLTNVRQSLRSGGVLLIEMMGKEVLARIFQPCSVESLPDGSLLVDRRSVAAGWSRIRNIWVLIRKGRAREFRLELNLYSGQEIADLLRRFGFADIRLYGDLEGHPYDAGAMRLIVVAKKL